MSNEHPWTGRRAATVFDEPGVLVVKSGWFERFFLPGLMVTIFGWIGTYELVTGDGFDALVGLGYLAVAGLTVWILTFRVALAVGAQTVVVRNPLRTYVFPIVDVIGTDPEYAGLRLHLANEAGVTVVAVQKWNVSKWLNQRTRADELGEYIQGRAESLRAGHG